MLRPPVRACCACGSPSQDGKLEIKGKPVAIAGLPLIFQQLQKKGLQPDEDCGDTLLKTVKIYHSIDAHEEADYRDALVAAYRAYCERVVRHGPFLEPTMNDEPQMENEPQSAKTGTHSRMKTALLVVGVIAVGAVMALTGKNQQASVAAFRSARGLHDKPRHQGN